MPRVCATAKFCIAFSNPLPAYSLSLYTLLRGSCDSVCVCTQKLLAHSLISFSDKNLPRKILIFTRWRATIISLISVGRVHLQTNALSFAVQQVPDEFNAHTLFLDKSSSNAILSESSFAQRAFPPFTARNIIENKGPFVQSAIASQCRSVTRRTPREWNMAEVRLKFANEVTISRRRKD